MSEAEDLSKTSSENASGIAQRRSTWEASVAAISYIRSVCKQKNLNVRQSDKVTAISLMLATLAVTLCLLLHKPTVLSMQLMGLCDFFLGISLTIYVCNRLGILTSLPPRQAALVWQLLKAFAFVGVFITFNLTLVLSLVLSCISTSNPH